MFPADWVVLSTPLIPSKDEILLAKMMKIPIADDGFMMEAHLKLRPVDTNVDGIFIAGTVSGPKDIPESIISGEAAAARASILMHNGKVKAEAITAVVDESLCIGCGLCEEICPYGAPRIEEGKSKIREVLCRGCGSCAAECPKQAIAMHRYRDDQILAQVKALLLAVPKIEAKELVAASVFEEKKKVAEDFEPLIVAYCCNWCSYAGADLAGTSRFEYPSNIRIVRVMCTGRIEPTLALEALRAGADGVLIAGCHPGDCHYQKGNFLMEKRFDYMKKAAVRMGIEPERLRLEWISASEGGKWAALVREITQDIRRLGPSPLRPERISEMEAVIDAFKAQRLRWVVGRSQLKLEIEENKYRQTVDSIMQVEVERHMITLALKNKGALTVGELALDTGLKPSKIVQHMIALRKTGTVSEVGEKNGQFLYKLV